MKQKNRWIRWLLPAAVFLAAVIAVLPGMPYCGDPWCWMAEMPDSTVVTEMTIPGTHDSGALHSIADVAGKCQSMTIEDQLAVGVRFLDLRLQLRGDSLAVVHDFVDQRQDFAKVLADAAAFVRENPSEFLLLSLKQDASAVRAEGSFAECLEAMLQDYGDVICTSSVLPETLGEARGRIYVISRYGDTSIGIPAHDGWQDNASFSLGTMFIQDQYRVDTVEAKQTAILAVDTAPADALVLNFTSCYLTHGFPPLYAGTPARQINPWLSNLLAEGDFPRGVLICDFMTPELAKIIIGRNFA